MGKENTITTGNVGGKRVARTVGNASGGLSNTSRNLRATPYDYGIVTFVDSTTKAIFYTPVEDNQSFTKPGQAIPLYPNSTQVPKQGNIVPLLRAPDSNVTTSGQAYSKVTYYLDYIGFNGTVNDNTVTVSGTTSASIPAKVTLNTEELLNNAKYIKEFLKSQGLTKEQSAGIMGNIQAESSFNPSSKFDDLNGYPSYGLIQWNARYTSPNLVGNTVESQMKALFDTNITPNISKYLSEVKSKPTETADMYAYIFAKDVEICFGCNEGFDTYKNGKTTKSGDTFKQYKRSEYALDFMNKFNNASDPLAW
jgi:hypothetical protein